MPNIALIEGNKLSDSGSDLTAISGQTYSRLHSGRDFPNGTLIETTIDYSLTNGDPWVLEISGNSYFSLIPFDLTYQGYIYNNTMIAIGGMSIGTAITGMSLFNYNGKLCFWFPYQGYWQGFNVYVYTAQSGRKQNQVTTISNVAKPAGITKELSMTFQQVVRTSSSTIGTANYVSKFTGNGILGDSQIFDNGTNVGIGTASPFSKFTVSATGSASQISIVNTGGGHFILRSGIPGISNNGASFVIADVDGSNQNTRMVISNTGNVGIGTASPAYTLDVAGQGRFAGQGTGTAIIGNAGFTSNYTGISLNGTLDNASYNFLSSPTEQTLFINRPSSFGIRFREANGDQMTIATGGNVGINTINPAGKLDVVGASAYFGIGSSSDTFLFLRGFNGGLVRFQSNSGFSGTYNGLGITTNSNGVNSLPSWNFDFGGQDGVNFLADAFSIYRKPNGGSYTGLFAILSSGETLVGRTTAVGSHRLQVNGNISINGSGSYLDFQNGDVRLVNSGGNLSIQTYSASTTLTTKVYISGTGNVGINTSDPDSTTLRIVPLATDTVQRVLHIGYNGSMSTGTHGSIITFGNSAPSSGQLARIGSFYEGGTFQGSLRFYTNANTEGASPSERMRIMHTGFVGIGTTTPLAPLHVDRTVTGSTTADRTTPVDVLILESENTADAEYTGFGQSIVFRGATYGNTTLRALGRIIHQINDNSVATTIGTSLDFQLTSDPTSSTLVSRLNISGTGVVTISNLAGSGSRIVMADANGTLSATTVSSSIVGGSGTTNYLAKFTASGTIGNSQIFDNGTNVGIGNTAPNQKLELSVGNGVTGGIRINYAAGATTEGMDITYLNTGSTTTSFDSRYNGDAAVMQFRMKTAATAVTAMTILGTGNVGIGTSTPGARLSVGAGTGNPISTQFAAVVKGTSSRTIYLDSDSGGASIWWGNGATPHFAIDSISGGGATFWTYASSTWNERMRLLPNGNFLINTTSDAGYKFDVNGTTRFGGTSLFSSAVTFSGDITQKTFTSVVITNLGASGTQARQFEIIRGFYDFNDWSPTGIVEIEVHERQYSRGLMKRYVFSYGYYDSSNLTLVEMVGAGDNNFRVTMGTKTLISGDMYYVPVYLEAKYYGSVDVIIRTRRTRTTNNLSTTAGDIYINESPTAVNISDFSSDTTVYPSHVASNQVITGNLGVGVVPSYKLDVSGTGNFSDTLTLSGPSRLAAVSGNSLVFRTSGADRMYLNTSGDLLVGGTYNPYGAANRANITLVGSTNGQILAFATSSVFNGYVYHDNTDMTIANDRNGNIKIFTNAAEVVRITSTGNLGVGTTTPTFTSGKGVHVKFSGDAVIRITSGSNTGFDLQQAVDGTNYIYNRDNSAFVFGTNNTERVRIAADGKLIVNSASSFGAYQFQVNGASYISGAVTLANLAGSGSRMVVTDANGLLSTQAIPSGGGGSGTVTSVGITVGSSGTDVNVSNSPITTSGNITLNIPDASATARGLVNTGTQTFAGDKTFTGTTTLNSTRTSITNGSYGMYMLTTYNIALATSNVNVYTSVDALTLNLTNGALTGNETFNVTANLNQVSVAGNASTISTQPIRGIISGILGIPSAATMNIADFRYFEAKTPDRAALTGHIVQTIYGLKISQLKGATGYTITNGWGIYQEGTQDNNYFAGNVIVGSTTVGSYKLDVTNNFRVNTGTVPVAIESFSNPGIGTVASVYSTGSASTIAFGSQANDTYLVGGYVFIGNQSAKFMIQADVLTGAYDGWGSIGSSGKYMKEVYTNYLVDKVNFNRQTASYTLVSGDRSKVIEMNVGSANTVTVPTNASVAFPIGTQINIIQYGAGQTTIAGAGVTFRSTNNWLKINAQYGSATLVKVGTDEWYVIGNLSA